jgi:hypothetical protein
MAEQTTIVDSRVVDRRNRAIQLDPGEEKPIWFPLSKTALDEANSTVSRPKKLVTEKLADHREPFEDAQHGKCNI